MIDEIDVVFRNLADTREYFYICPYLLDSFDTIRFDIANGEWGEVKFLNDTGDNLNNLIDLIPNDQGGIYVFFAKPNLIPEIHNYIMYVGRAKKTNKQNLRKRCKEYFSERNVGRPKIRRMISYWGKYLYIKYLPLNDNAYIDELEAELIKCIEPPFNDKIPDKKIMQARSMF